MKRAVHIPNPRNFSAGVAYTTLCFPHGGNLAGAGGINRFRTTTVRRKVTCKRCLRMAAPPAGQEPAK